MRGRPWFTECAITGVANARSNASLVRGVNASGGVGDTVKNADTVIDSQFSDWDSRAFRQQVDALTVEYTGPGTAASISVSGNETENRTITAKVDGVTVSRYTVTSYSSDALADRKFYIRNVADWLNGVTPDDSGSILADFSAVVLDDETWRATQLYKRGDVGGDVIDVDVTAPYTFITASDQHADSVQYIGAQENMIVRGNTVFGFYGQLFFITSSGTGGVLADIMVLNNAATDIASENNQSQMAQPHRHVVVAHNSLARQRFSFRTDNSFSGDGYCLFSNNVAPSIVFNAGLSPGIPVVGNHVQTGAAAIEALGAVDTTEGGTDESLFADSVNGDFRPRGALLTNPEVAVVSFGQANAARGQAAAKGAIAG